MKLFSFHDPAFLRTVQGGGGGGGGGGGSYPAGAVAAYHFDSNGTDATGRGNDLTAASPAWVSPKLGTKAVRNGTIPAYPVMRVDGTGGDLQAAAAFSLVGWLKNQNGYSTGTGVAIAHGSGGSAGFAGDHPDWTHHHYWLGLQDTSGNYISFVASLNNGADSITINGYLLYPRDTWHFAALVFDGTDLKLSVNGGAFQSTPASAPAIASAVFALVIPRGSYAYMEADEVVKWNYALTIGQVQYLYNSGNGRAYAP